MSSEAKGVERPARFNTDWKPPTSKKNGTFHGRTYSGPADQSGPQIPTSVIEELRKRAPSQETTEQETANRRAILERLRDLPRKGSDFEDDEKRVAPVHVIQRGSAPASPRKDNLGARVRSLTPDGRTHPNQVKAPPVKEAAPPTQRRSIWSLFHFGKKPSSKPPSPRRPLPVPPNHGRDPSLGELDKPDLSLVEDDPKNESAWGKICDLSFFNDVNEFNAIRSYVSDELDGFKDRLSPSKKSILRVIQQINSDFLDETDKNGYIESLANQTLNECVRKWIVPNKFPNVKLLTTILLEIESRANKWRNIHRFFIERKTLFTDIVKYIKGDLQKEEFAEDNGNEALKKQNGYFKKGVLAIQHPVLNAHEHYTASHQVNLKEAIQRSLNAIVISRRILKDDPAPEASFDQILDGLVLVVEKLKIKFPIPDPQGQPRGNSSSTQP